MTYYIFRTCCILPTEIKINFQKKHFCSNTSSCFHYFFQIFGTPFSFQENLMMQDKICYMTVLDFVLGNTFPIKKKFISENRIRSYIDHSIQGNFFLKKICFWKNCFYKSSDMFGRQKAIIIWQKKQQMFITPRTLLTLIILRYSWDCIFCRVSQISCNLADQDRALIY